MRVLVSAEGLSALPTKIELPQIGNYGGKTCIVNYSGLPEGCNACATHARSSQNCPLESGEEDFFEVVTSFGQTCYPISDCTKKRGMNIVNTLQQQKQQQTILQSDEHMVLKQANCILEDEPIETDWGSCSWEINTMATKVWQFL